MNTTNKNILLGIAVLFIVGAIWYIESSKPAEVTGTSIAVSPTSTTTPVATDRAVILKQKAAHYSSAIELIPGGKFINTEPFKLKDVIGKKVILVDFWTYTCINCLRTLPYVEAWNAKYKDQGLVIIGVHSPEFGFEKDYNNVVDAVKRLGVTYPVMQDNDHATWDAYQNQYWPAEYLIDIDGYITDTHFGEGNYDQTEQKIQAALKERDQVLGLPDTVPTGVVNPSNVATVSDAEVQSPETYFGAARNESLGNGTKDTVGTQELRAPSTIQENTLYLDGSWNFRNEYAENTAAGAKIIYKYNSKNVYFVGTASNSVKITILLDGKPISAERGADVAADGTAVIQENRLYKLVEGSDYGDHTLEIIINSPGLQAYTFTFG
ncbi:redoxin family protein [Candidatus Kaiserbacteria bacterium]|nr:redoxin family protein [Candidatus Kaiserbacteria bacterium]